jgi:hypothetical protein
VVSRRAHLVTAIGLTFALLAVFETPAHADVDVWGAYGAGSVFNTPNECLFAGVDILKGSTPDKHNVSATNACDGDHDVAARLLKLSSANQVLNSCNLHYATKNKNYHQCPLQDSTAGSEYWAWDVNIYDSNDRLVQRFGCSQANSSDYNKCFSELKD